MNDTEDSAQRLNRDTAIVSGVGAFILLGVLYLLLGVGTGVLAICPNASATWTRIYFGGVWTLPLIAVGFGAVFYRKLRSRSATSAMNARET